MACGAFLPLPAPQAVGQLPDLPPVLARVGEALDRLAEMESVDNKSLEPFREQLEDLKRMHRNEMYSHAGLEAADALKGKRQRPLPDYPIRCIGRIPPFPCWTA